MINQLNLVKKNKHLINKYHRHLSNSIINRYHIENPNFLETEDILNKYTHDYNKNLAFILLYVNGN